MKRIFSWISPQVIVVLSVAQSEPTIQRVWAFQDTVGLYEKYEAQISVKANFVNPFDPDEIDVTAEFTSPSGKIWTMPAFYGATGFSFTARFSADEIGKWGCTVKVKDRDGEAVSDPTAFYVAPSQFHGAIRVSPVNHRYLEYADGAPFYGVGLWYNNGLGGPRRSGSTEDDLDELKNLGVNFISAFMTPIETFGSGVGRYDQELCTRIDQLLEQCEKRDIVLSLNLWFHAFLSETVWPGGNRRWMTNPYQFVCPAKEFYRSEAAWALQEKLYRYIIARWSYSRSLGIWFVIDEVNGTDGWVSGDSLGAGDWAGKVQQFFKNHDPYNHPATGTRSGGVREWWGEGYQTFDLAAREIYEAQGFPILMDGKIDRGDEHPLKLSYMNYVGEIRKLWDGFEKPAIIGETGWDHTFYEPNMPGYLAQYHNTLWAGLASGLPMTPFWWSYGRFINDNVVTQQMSSIARFASEIPFSTLTNIKRAQATLSNGDAFAMKSDQLVFGWVVNPVTDVTAAIVKISDIPAGDYTLRLFHTWRGRFFHEEKVTSKKGAIEFTIPVLKITDDHAQYVGQDIAFILQPTQ
jgi:hypothetical protein